MTDSTSGVDRIARERRRQIEEEGYTAEHDDRHTAGDLAVFAAALAVYGTDAQIEDPLERVGYRLDGREADDWGLLVGHRRDRLRQLEIAGALIAAEIDRVERREAADGELDVKSTIEHLTGRVGKLEEKVDALLTQDHAVSRWGRGVEARLEDLEGSARATVVEIGRLVSGEGDIGRLPDVSDEPAAMDSSRSRWTLRDAHRALSTFLQDEDLNDEKLRAAAGDLLPKVHDALARYIDRPDRMNSLQPYDDESLLEELVSRGTIHPSRLIEDHYVLLRASTYHMVHPLSCNLGDCPFDEEAKSWDHASTSLRGWYRWPDWKPEALDRVPDEELPFDPP